MWPVGNRAGGRSASGAVEIDQAGPDIDTLALPSANWWWSPMEETETYVELDDEL